MTKALWDGFISSITYADDENYILSQAVRFGFFPSADGWNIETKAIGESITTYDEIRNYPYRYIRPSVEVLSYLEVIHILFGEKNIRKTLPAELEECFGINMGDLPRIDLEKYEKLDEKLCHLEHSQELLRYLDPNEGLE